MRAKRRVRRYRRTGGNRLMRRSMLIAPSLGTWSGTAHRPGIPRGDFARARRDLPACARIVTVPDRGGPGRRVVTWIGPTRARPGPTVSDPGLDRSLDLEYPASRARGIQTV